MNKHIVAVSGGADSMALLHSMIGGDLHVAHVNHQINIDEANAAQELVEKFCENNGIGCHVGTFDVPKLAQERKRGIEETAREVRYAYFADLLDELNADYYLTAHTADDNAETILLHMLRGCGTKGLCGMSELNGKHMRPFLNVTRKQIEQYIVKHDIKCAVDSSNESLDYTRNRIRHELMPLLREFNPQIDDALNRLAQVVKQDVDSLEALTIGLVHQDDDGGCYCLKVELDAVPQALRVRALQTLYPCAVGLEQKHITAMLDAIERQSGTELPNKLRLNVRKGKVTIDDNPAVVVE